jgi:hypothetical protein
MMARRVATIVALTLFSISMSAGASSATTKSPLSIRVDLTTTSIRAGHTVYGVALVTNSSSKSIRVQTWECDQWLLVGLANKDVPYDPAVAISACSDAIILEPGVNRVPITVSTMYQECAGGPPTGKKIDIPWCPKTGMPALPKGTYHVVVITNGIPKIASYSRVRVTIS